MNAEQILDRIDRTPECWLWTGAVTSAGYGALRPGGGQHPVLAHRHIYEMLVGPVPEGLVMDHLCRVTTCVRPSHLEPVTQGENLRRGRIARGYAA